MPFVHESEFQGRRRRSIDSILRAPKSNSSQLVSVPSQSSNAARTQVSGQQSMPADFGRVLPIKITVKQRPDVMERSDMEMEDLTD